MISEETRNKLTTIAENQQKVYDNGVADGKRAEYDAFWDAVTHNWTRTDYRWGLRWKCQYIRPPRKIIPTSSQGVCYMFADNHDLLKIEKAYFDFSQKVIDNQTTPYYGHQRVFSGCMNLVEVEDIGMQPAYYDATFYDCLSLEKIEVIRSQEDTIFTDDAFGYCLKLKDLVIEGVIGRNFNIKWSPLSPASLKSIVKHLKDYSGTDKEFAYTVTFKTSAFEQLGTNFDNDDYEWFEATFNMSRDTIINANLSWRDMIAGLCWNLATA